MAEELREAAPRQWLASEGPVLTRILSILWPLLRQLRYDFGALETFARQHGVAEGQTGTEEHYLPDGKSEKDSRLPLAGHAILPGIAPPGEQKDLQTMEALHTIRELDLRLYSSTTEWLSETAAKLRSTEAIPGHGEVVDLTEKHGRPAKNPPDVRSAPRRKTPSPRRARN